MAPDLKNTNCIKSMELLAARASSEIMRRFSVSVRGLNSYKT